MSRDTCERCLGTSHLCPRGDTLHTHTVAIGHSLDVTELGGPLALRALPEFDEKVADWCESE
jgi:hypothetical protein